MIFVPHSTSMSNSKHHAYEDGHLEIINDLKIALNLVKRIGKFYYKTKK